MRDIFIFYPERRGGLVFHGLAILGLFTLGAWGIWLAIQAEVGPLFLLYLLPALLAAISIPFLVYRGYALWKATYLLERDGIILHWGLRGEEIPMQSVEWIKPANELDISLPLPFLRLPGALVGKSRLPDGTRLEFMAASSHNLLLIATPGRVFAISPADLEGFWQAYHAFSELGAINTRIARSIYPTFLLARAWSDVLARSMLLAGFVLLLILMVLVVIYIPSTPIIRLGVNPAGMPGDLVPGIQLLMLPFINAVFYFGDVLLGLFFYRLEKQQSLAYLIWGSAVVTGVLLLVALYFILQTT